MSETIEVARDLRREGYSIWKIARELDRDPERVRSWMFPLTSGRPKDPDCRRRIVHCSHCGELFATNNAQYRRCDECRATVPEYRRRYQRGGTCICVVCGESYEADDRRSRRCPTCVRMKRRRSMEELQNMPMALTLQCSDCGNDFEAFHRRCKRCPSCKAQRKLTPLQMALDERKVAA